MTAGDFGVRVGGREPTPRENTHVEYAEQVRRDEDSRAKR